MDVISANDSAALNFALGNAETPHLFSTENLPRLLLVDDEPMLLSSLCELLKDRGCQLLTATCGSEALEHLNRLQFDLVLLDYGFPILVDMKSWISLIPKGLMPK